MSENPKFEVIDRRKVKAEEEERESREKAQQEAEKPAQAPEPEAEAASKPAPGPRLVVNEEQGEAKSEPPSEPSQPAGAAEQMPQPPTAEQSQQQKAAYDASAQRIEDLIRAQNPGIGAQPPMSFEHLVQQFYLTAMLQMGAATQEGERPRVDIVGARATIDLLGIMAEKTKGNLTEQEDRAMQTVLFDVRMAFLELSKMISLQGVQPPPPPKSH